MTPTPRTNLLELENIGLAWGDAQDAVLGLARELERELAAERALADRLERELAVWKHEANRLEEQLNAFDETAISWWCEYQDLKDKARQQ